MTASLALTASARRALAAWLVATVVGAAALAGRERGIYSAELMKEVAAKGELHDVEGVPDD